MFIEYGASFYVFFNFYFLHDCAFMFYVSLHDCVFVSLFFYLVFGVFSVSESA